MFSAGFFQLGAGVGRERVMDDAEDEVVLGDELRHVGDLSFERLDSFGVRFLHGFEKYHQGRGGGQRRIRKRREIRRLSADLLSPLVVIGRFSIPCDLA